MKGLLFTYLLTYGGAVSALFNPFVGLLIYVCFAIIRPEALWHYSVPPGGNYSRIVAIGLLVGWAFSSFGDWNLGRAGSIVVALLCFFGWAALGAPFAVADTEIAWAQVEEYAKFVLPFLVGITTIRTRRQLEQLAWVIAISQGYLAYEFNQMYYSSPWFDPNEWSFGGLDRNGIAITMVTSAGLSFFLGLYASKWWQKLLGLGMAGLMVHVVLFSMSRGGMLALIVTGVVVFILIPKRPLTIAVAILALGVGLRLAGPEVMKRFDSTFTEEDDRDASAQSRVQLWGAALNVALSNPVFGIGSANWRQVAHLYGFTRGKDAHSTWLRLAAETGLMGLVWILFFYGTTVTRLWLLARDSSFQGDPWLRMVPHMVITALAGFVVSGQFVSCEGVELPIYIVLLGAGALKLAYLESEAASTQQEYSYADLEPLSLSPG